jgi:hypothetical protein
VENKQLFPIVFLFHSWLWRNLVWVPLYYGIDYWCEAIEWSRMNRRPHWYVHLHELGHLGNVKLAKKVNAVNRKVLLRIFCPSLPCATFLFLRNKLSDTWSWFVAVLFVLTSCCNFFGWFSIFGLVVILFWGALYARAGKPLTLEIENLQSKRKGVSRYKLTLHKSWRPRGQRKYESRKIKH